MAMADDDDRLLAEARQGDRVALEQLLERHQARAYRFGMKMCRDPEDAKDVVQDTLLAMARGIRDFRGASSISTWLYTIARSYCIKKHRRSKFAPTLPSSLDADPTMAERIVDPSKPADEALAGKHVELALEQAIAALDPTYREVLVLRDVEGLTAPQVAEVLGVSVQAVKSRLHRARLSVRERVAPIVEGQTPSAGGCPDVLSLFSQHLEGQISKETCAEMERHLEGCVRCRAACDSLRRTLSLCHHAGTSADVPPEVQASVKVALRNFFSDDV